MFLVKPNKLEEYSKKKFVFYNYDKKVLLRDLSFNFLSTEPLLNDPADIPLADYAFDLIIITLPTDILLSEVGKQLVKSLKSCAKLKTSYLVLSPGYTVYDKVFKPLHVPPELVSFGLSLFLCHEVSKTNFNDKKFTGIEQADLAFHYLRNSFRIMILSSKPRSLKLTLSQAKCGSIALGINMLEASTAMFLLLHLMLDLQEWPKKLKKSDDSFKAAIKAWYEITRFHGKSGNLLRWTVGKNMYKFVNSMNQKFSKPLTLDFMKYHHGGKVKEQNVSVIEFYLAEGKNRNLKIDKIEAFIEICRGGGTSNIQHFLEEPNDEKNNS